jgi:ubiquinone/menaquinone biosynthesis C-methylase UbiE
MPTVKDNRLIFNSNKYWVHYGEEWSRSWGGPSMHWHSVILPRIYRFLPAHTILDLGAGQGRFAQFLKQYTETLILVDLSEPCIEICKQRFSLDSNIKYYVNDGKSLNMIDDDSVDFVFSHDALVFVEEQDLREYIHQLARKLKNDGAAFLHHSNLGQYWYYSKLSQTTIKYLRKLKIIEDDFWRAYSVSAKNVSIMCHEVGLECIVQEIIPWYTKKTFVDCYSLIVHKDSKWKQKPRVFRNRDFEQSKLYINRLARYYDPNVEKYIAVPVTYDSLNHRNNNLE